jgi:hypothetical protein
MVERIALAALALCSVFMGYSLFVAADRFGTATDAFDGVEIDFVDFRYERGQPAVDFSLDVANPSQNTIRVVAIEYSFVVNGVQAGGGDLRPGEQVEAEGIFRFGLQGRVADRTYVDGLEPDEPLEWLVLARMLVNVDERLDSTWFPFSFRAETP